MVAYRDERSFVMADIPGIIEDAHKGKGLGHRFLRHIERNASLLFMISAESENIAKEYEILLNECVAYNSELRHKNRILAITKADLIDAELEEMLIEDIPDDIPYVFISSITGKGIMQLKDMIWRSITDTP
jgi:GTP-binding protein